MQNSLLSVAGLRFQTCGACGFRFSVLGLVTSWFQLKVAGEFRVCASRTGGPLPYSSLLECQLPKGRDFVCCEIAPVPIECCLAQSRCSANSGGRSVLTL